MPSVSQDHEWQYNPRKSVPDFDRYAARATKLSEEARATLTGRYDLRYGSGQLATLDVFPAARSDAPLHVFIHGGYWRGRDKSEYSFLARTLVKNGITAVIMNYDLCPQVTLPEIVTQVRKGLRWIAAHAADLGGRADAMTASGNSAGAHLVAAALSRDAGSDRLPDTLLKRAVAISGIYELEPVLGITVNAEIRLTEDMVDPMSPMRHPPISAVPLDIVVGGAETPKWIAQSKSFADVCRRAGSQVTYTEIAGHDHFSIMTLLEDAESPLARIILDAARAM